MADESVPGPSRGSELDPALAAAIASRGYEAEVGYRVGRLPLDLVVRGRNGRLALDVSGRSGGTAAHSGYRLHREALERLGWRFHRVRGSEFYRNEAATLEKLWTRLEHLRIEPVTTD